MGGQWWTQDFPETVHQPVILQKIAENCMKIKEFGPRGRVFGALHWIRY